MYAEAKMSQKKTPSSFSNWSILKRKYLCERENVCFYSQEGDFDLLRTLRGVQAFTVCEKQNVIRRWNNIKESVVSISFLWSRKKKSHQVKAAFMLHACMLTAESEEFTLWENTVIVRSSVLHL